MKSSRWFKTAVCLLAFAGVVAVSTYAWAPPRDPKKPMRPAPKIDVEPVEVDATEKYQSLMGAVEGTATNQFSKEPIEGVELAIGGKKTKSASDGSFKIEGLNPGQYIMTWAKKGYLGPSGYQFNVYAGKTFNVSVIIFPAGPIVRGTVRGQAGGKLAGLSQVDVAFSDGTKTKTGYDGGYGFDFKEVSSYPTSVTFSKEGYESKTMDVPAMQVWDEITLDAVLKLATVPYETATLYGQVDDAKVNKPLPGATITVTTAAGPTVTGTTDSSGKYKVAGIPTGMGKIVYSKPGYQSSLPISYGFETNEEKELSVGLSPL